MGANQKGSHVKFVRRRGEIVDTAIVPKEPEIPAGTQRSILSQAHIPPDVWHNLAWLTPVDLAACVNGRNVDHLRLPLHSEEHAPVPDARFSHTGPGGQRR